MTSRMTIRPRSSHVFVLAATIFAAVNAAAKPLWVRVPLGSVPRSDKDVRDHPVHARRVQMCVPRMHTHARMQASDEWWKAKSAKIFMHHNILLEPALYDKSFRYAASA